MSPRLRLLLPLAALGMTAVGYAPQEAFSYQTGAKRADLVVQEIAQKLGTPLATTDDAKKHYLIIAVTDVDSEAVLTRVAKVTSSKWTDVNGVRTLVIDEAVRRTEKAEIDAKRVEEFKKAQAEFKKRLDAKPFDFEKLGEDEDVPDDYVWPYDTPAEKALAELVLMIDPREAARISDNGRVVFSTLPNRMQRPMNSAQATRILAALVADHNKWAVERIKELEEQKKEMVGDPEMAQYLAMFGEDEKPKLFDGAPSKALLVIESGSEFFDWGGGELTVELKIYDRKGGVVIQESAPINSRVSQMMDEYEIGPDGEYTKKVPDEQKNQEIKPEDRVIVEFSAKTKQLAAMEGMNDMTLNLPDTLLAVLRDPVENDPLGFHHTDILHAVAKHKKLDVVANLSDTDMFESFQMGPASEGVTVGTAYNSLKDEDVSNVEEKDGWLVISPKDPNKARETRLDRASLKRFIDVLTREGTATLDSLSQFALDSPSPMENGTSMIYLLAFAPNSIQGILGDTMDWPMLRFYATLSPQQKTGLRQNGRITFGQLTQRSRDVLTKMAFGSNARIKPADKMADSAKMPFFMELMGGMFGGRQAKDFTEEPTEVMPNGLPGDGFVTAIVTNEPVARPAGEKAMMFMMFGTLSADELAMFEIMKSSSAMQEAGEAGEMFDLPKQVRLGSREKLNFQFWLSPAAGITKTLMDDTVSKDAQTISLDNLPAEFKALIEQRKKAIMASPFGKLMTSGIGG
jgi:hypothetical protein